MAQCDVVHIVRPSIVVRKELHNLFSKFGKIIKLYVHPTGEEAKVYYSDIKSAQEAISSLNGNPPHYFKLSLRSEFCHKLVSLNDCTSQDDKLSSHSSMLSNDFDAAPGNSLYTIFGQEVITFQSDSGEAFVSVNELRKHGFELYKEKHVPIKVTDSDYLKQLKMYLSIKTRKYLSLFPHETNPENFKAVTNKVIADYTRDEFPRYVPPTKLILNSSIEKRNQFHDNIQNRKKNPTENTSFSLRKPHVTNGSTEEKSVVTKEKCSSSLLGKIFHPPYKIVELPLLTPVEVCVTHVVNLQRGYVYIKSRLEHLKSLLLKTKTEAAKSSPVTVPELGKIYAALFEGEWYRAVVLQTQPLKVLYIDFGNRNDEPVDHVRRLSDQLCAIPAEGISINFGSNTLPEPLKYDGTLYITASRQNSDRSYQVDIVKRNQTKSTSLKPIKNTFEQSDANVTPSSTKNVISPKSTKNTFEQNDANGSTSPHNVICGNIHKHVGQQNNVVQKNVKTIRNISLTKVAEKIKMETPIQKTLNPNGSTIVDGLTSGEGIMQFFAIIKNQCLCFVCPHSAIMELNALEEIHGEKDPNYTPKVGESVAVYKQNEEKWVRGRILNTSNNSVALIDYGLVETTDNICKLEKKFLDIPEFACVCIGSSKFKEEIVNDLQFKAIGDNKLEVSFNDGTKEEIICGRWDPFLVDPPAATSNEPEVVFTTRPSLPCLQDNEKVLIANYNEGKIMVRNRYCNTLYDKITNSIANYKATKLNGQPEKKQIVLSPYEDSLELHRAIVLSVKEKQAEVEFIDLGIIDTVAVASISMISESLAGDDLTLISIMLKGFESDQYSDNAIELLQEYCNTKEKFIARKISTDAYDLITNNQQSLSEILSNCDKSDRCLYHQLPTHDIKTGKLEVLCVNNDISNGMVTFLSMEGETKNYISLLADETAKLTDAEGYKPVQDEICLANFEDEWCRCRVLKDDSSADQYKIDYIDYGNSVTVPSGEIRKLPEELGKIYPLAINCTIDGIADDLEVRTGFNYVIDILSVSGTSCSANIISSL